MGKARQTVERRQLGLALKRLREGAKKSQGQAGDHIGVSDSRISKVEDGTATLDLTELERLLDLYEVEGSERETIRALGVEARKRQPRGSAARPGTYTDTLPHSFQRVADMEADARVIYCYESGVVPGLLQSPRYMRAILRAGDGVWWREFGEELESRAAFRQDRQDRILEAADEKELNFVFTEDALAEDGRHPDVMREQLEHLLSLREKHPNLIIQVLRCGALDNPAPNGGMVVLDFQGNKPRVAFTSVIFGPSTYFSDLADTNALLRAFLKIQALAMGPAESMEFIREKLQEN